jgi:hypothetical protein
MGSNGSPSHETSSIGRCTLSPRGLAQPRVLLEDSPDAEVLKEETFVNIYIYV